MSPDPLSSRNKRDAIDSLFRLSASSREGAQSPGQVFPAGSPKRSCRRYAAANFHPAPGFRQSRPWTTFRRESSVIREGSLAQG